MIWESKINANKVFKLKYGGVNLYFGVGAINKIREILRDLKGRGITRILIVTGRMSYRVCGAWDYVKPALEEHNIQYVLYDKVSANPTVNVVDDTVRIGKEFKAQAVLGIGDESPIDTAKAVAALLPVDKNANARELFMERKPPQSSLPVISINTAHGQEPKLIDTVLRRSLRKL